MFFQDERDVDVLQKVSKCHFKYTHQIKRKSIPTNLDLFDDVWIVSHQSDLRGIQDRSRGRL